VLKALAVALIEVAIAPVEVAGVALRQVVIAHQDAVTNGDGRLLCSSARGKAAELSPKVGSLTPTGGLR
jgi:hypothetical protein